MHSLKGILHDLFRREIKNGLLLGHSFISPAIHSITALRIQNQPLTYQRSENDLASSVLSKILNIIVVDKERSINYYDLICNYTSI